MSDVITHIKHHPTGILLTNNKGLITYMCQDAQAYIETFSGSLEKIDVKNGTVLWLASQLERLCVKLQEQSYSGKSITFSKISNDKGLLLISAECLHPYREENENVIIVKLTLDKSTELKVKENADALPLTKRQKEVAIHIGLLHTASDICGQLKISYSTYKDHLRKIYMSLNINKREDLILILR